MGAAGQHFALRGQDLERGDPDAVYAVDIPAVPPVRLDVGRHMARPAGGAGGQGFHVDAALGRVGHGVDRSLEGGGAGRSGGGEHPLDQAARLGRPRHHLGVEDEPVGAEAIPQPRGGDRGADSIEEGPGERRLSEERPAGAGDDDAGFGIGDAESRLGGVGVAGGDEHSP